MREQIEAWADQRGILTAWADAHRLVAAVQGDIERALAGDPGLGDWCRSLLESFRYLTELPPPPATAVVLAAKSTGRRIRFRSPEREILAVIPPTYWQTARRDLARLMASVSGDRARRLPAPIRAAAARLGLVQYGRNGIGHVPGAGCQWELAGWVIPGEHGPLLPVREPQALDSCQSCRACIAACPTEALSGDGWVVRADRCLTSMNEQELPFPRQLDPAVHHCLIGCLRCQEACPENGPIELLDVILTVSTEELESLLSPYGDPALIGAVCRRLDDLGFGGWEGVLARNLQATDACGIRTLWPGE